MNEAFLNAMSEILAEIRQYFMVCLGNADPQSAQHERFTEFISALDVAAGIVQEHQRTEDDGK